MCAGGGNKVSKVKSVSQAMSYSVNERFSESAPQKNVVIIANGDESIYPLLCGGLAKEGCRVSVYSGLGEMSSGTLEDAALVFVFIGSLPAQSLYAQVGALVSQTQNGSVVPIVEYADQERPPRSSNWAASTICFHLSARAS